MHTSNIVHRHAHLQSATHEFHKALSDRPQLVESVLTRVVIDTIRRYQQKVSIGIQDSVTDLLATFKQKVAEEVFRVSQNWTVATHREPVIFPDGCRYLYTLGSSTLVVIEQFPCVRTLRLDKALHHKGNDRRLGAESSHSLAVPYTIFVLHFRNTVPDGSGQESLSNLYVGWRNRPLSSLKDEIYTPYLPNVYTKNYTVCTGENAVTSESSGGAAIAKLTLEVLTRFWGSTFNADLAAHWWEKPWTLNEWEDRSKDDPFFILEAEFKNPTPLEQLLRTICSATEDRSPETMDLRHQIAEQTDALSERMFQGIKNYLMKTKFDRFYPKEVTEPLGDTMETLAKELQTVALGLEMKLNSMAEEVECLKPKDFRWRKRSVYWTD